MRFSTGMSALHYLPARGAQVLGRVVDGFIQTEP